MRVFNAPPWNDDWSASSAGQRLADVLATPGSAGTCLRRGGTLVGFALGHRERWFRGRHFLLKEMCVDQPLQGRGHGGSLLTALQEQLPDVEQIYLITARGGPAQRFYQRHGYTHAASRGLMVRPLRLS